MLTIYHNPRCSKSRQTLALIEQANQDITVVEYLKTPLNQEDIRSLLTLLAIEPIAMMRKNEAEFKELQLDNADDDTLIMAMANTPKLIERPIVASTTRAIIGRPPENVLILF